MKKMVNGVIMDMTQEDIDSYNASVAEADAQSASEAAKYANVVAKLEGVDFQGTMCSATAEDMWGLSSIRSWVAAGNAVNFKFDNGNTLVLTSANLAAFEAVWIPFRAGFFA